MSYRPICDVWLLARSKVPYYGAYPAGFLERARNLLGCSLSDPVLHVCGGQVKQYPFRGFGKNDCTLDLDPKMKPTFIQDAGEKYPAVPERIQWMSDLWAGVLADPPYTEEDAKHYAPTIQTKSGGWIHAELPTARQILKNAINAVRVGGKVGILHYHAPRPDKTRAKFCACVAVVVGYENKVRLFSVYERLR